MGSFPTPFQVFTHFRFVAQRGYAGHRIAGRSAMKDTKQALAPRLSIAVRAWNEEAAIRATLDSLFQQSLFEELSKRQEGCEVLCIANGCIDRTAGIAAEVFEEEQQTHPFASAFTCRVAEIAEAGRNNTWNAFVHCLSHREAQFLYLMDSDIVFNRADTLANMYAALRNNPRACIASDRQHKDIGFKNRKSLRDRISLATSDMTRTIEGQITGQLYGIRADVARRVYLPKDLGAPDDGFIKALVCTDFFSEALDPSRIITVENASHVYAAYRSVREILNNQKRQMIGQTTVHVLVEHLKALPFEQRTNLAASLKEKEAADPDWLKRLINEHVSKAPFFWQLFPGIFSFRFKRWWKLSGLKKATHLPAACIGFAVTLIACAGAHRHLKRGLTTRYWPKADRASIERLKTIEPDDAGNPQPVKS